MRRRALSVALLVALAFAGARRADARGAVSGGQEWLGSHDDQPALLSGAPRDQRLARIEDGRGSNSPHGPAPASLPATATGSAAPTLIVLRRALPPASSRFTDACGATRTSRGPPPSGSRRF